MLKNVGWSVLSVAVTLLVVAVAGEIILRFLPYHSGYRSVAVNADQPVYRFEPNSTFRYSVGWDFKLAVERRTNGAGFLNDQEYDAEDPRPLMAVVGDSFVEAAQVSYADSFYGRLAASLGERGRVYSFAAGGAALSQYEAWARHAAETYSPDLFVFTIIGNDYDESLLAFPNGCRFGTVMPGMHYYVREGDGSLRLQRLDLEKSPLRELAKKSALLGYLVRNMHVLEAPRLFAALFDRMRAGEDAPAFAGQTCADADEVRLAGSRAVVDAWLERIPAATGLPPERTILVLDGLRPDLYDAGQLAAARETYVARMHAYMGEQAQARGFVVVDLNDDFVRRHRATGERFEFPFDGHWNAAGHAVAAAAIEALPLVRRTFNNRAPSARQEP